MLWVPMLSTPSGSTLTAKNWQSVGVSLVSYDLAALLIKPGVEVLKHFNSLNNYVGWSEKIILQATFPKPDRAGNYILRSPYDGNRLVFTAEEIISIIAWLKPESVLLPYGIDYNLVLEKLPASIFTYYAADDAPENTTGHGIYFKSSDNMPHSHGMKFCVYGPASQLQGKIFSDQGIQLLISDTPAEDACQGRLYTSHGTVDLMEQKQAEHHAYMSYLSFSTPLLYQRLAVMMNYSQ